MFVKIFSVSSRGGSREIVRTEFVSSSVLVSACVLASVWNGENLQSWTLKWYMMRF